MVKFNNLLVKFNRPFAKRITIAVFIVALILLIHLPFLNQAFHIDDTYFIYVARHILQDPLHAMSFKINWDGIEKWAYSFSGSPPLFEYYLAAVIKIFGESEQALHSSIMLVSFVAALCIYLLARRFTSHSLSCVFLALVSPAYMVMAHTLMLDIPALALYLFTVVAFIYGIDNDNNFLLILAGIFSGLTCLVKYNGLTLFALLPLYTFIKKRTFDRRMLYLGLGVVIFILYNYYTSFTYGKSHFSSALNIVGGRIVLIRIFVLLIALSSYIGGSAIFPLSLIFSSFLLIKQRAGLYLTLIMSLLAVVLVSRMLNFNLGSASMLFLFVFSFISFLYAVLKEGIYAQSWKNYWVGDNIFLFLWIIGVIAFHSLAGFVAVRFILYALTPLVILFFRLLEKKMSAKLVTGIAVTTIALTATLGFFVSVADCAYANVYRNFSSKIGQDYQRNGNNIWYLGHWGFQFYMDKQNYSQLEHFSTLPKNGDVLMLAVAPEPEILHPELLNRLRVLNVIDAKTSFPLRTMNDDSFAGFYTSKVKENFTFLPFSFSSNPILERFIILEVRD